MNFLKKIYPEKKLPKGTFKPAILGKFQFGADTRARYDVESQLEHTEDCYEIMLNGRVTASEVQKRSPATRWYTQDQVENLYKQAGFQDLEMLRGFSKKPARKKEGTFSVLGVKP